MSSSLSIASFVGEELSLSESQFEYVRPSDGRVIGNILEAGKIGVEAAIAAGREAFTQHRKSTVHDRASWLTKSAAALKSNVDQLANLICEDVGKPIRVARGEVRRGADFLEATASAITQMTTEVLPVDSSPAGNQHFGFTRRHPYGIVAGITPFNAPINLLIQKVAPAIAAGNAIIAKPAPPATRATVLAAKLFCECGLPKGLFSVLVGDRRTAELLVQHPDVRMVSFTGSEAGGAALARLAGSKRFSSELGSNAANVVFADADIDEAAKKIAGAAFEASGQQCISAQRVLVERTVVETFVQKFVAAAQALKVGPANDPATDIGPMVSAVAADRVMTMCEEAVAKGARYALEPRRNGAEVSPAILLDVARTSRLWQEEVFGPAAVVVPFDGTEEALQLANDSPFGLQGAVFTSSLATAMRFSNDFDVGALWINEASRFRLDLYPFGGMKNSGSGREGVRYAIEEFSQLKFTGMKL